MAVDVIVLIVLHVVNVVSVMHTEAICFGLRQVGSQVHTFSGLVGRTFSHRITGGDPARPPRSLVRVDVPLDTCEDGQLRKRCQGFGDTAS